MSVGRVREYLKQYGLEERVKEFAVSSATVELAAQAVGVEAARIAKTLSFHLGDGCVLVVAAGDARIDNHKFKETFHTKAKMLTADEALAMTGHAVGGVCPLPCPRACACVWTSRFSASIPSIPPRAAPAAPSGSPARNCKQAPAANGWTCASCRNERQENSAFRGAFFITAYSARSPAPHPAARGSPPPAP